jgi:ribosome-associated toxin RatA of RatAB toxin-antitoxin module
MLALVGLPGPRTIAAMASRVVLGGGLLAVVSVACINTSQPRSRRAVLDSAVPPPAAAIAAPPPALEPAAPDVAEVEIVPVAGSSLGRARATVVVRAPLERVRAVVFDFPHYPAFIPNYKSAEVESTTPEGGMRVHMKIDALGGMIRRWMRVDVSPPSVDGARETFHAKLVEGDVKAFETRWVLERCSGGTRLTLESFLDAKLQLPAAFIDAGSAAGIKESILSIKARAEEGVP